MDAKTLIERLEKLGFTPEEYHDQLYASGSYQSEGKTLSNTDIEEEIGPWRAIEREEDAEITEYNYTETRKRTILYFEHLDIYLATNTFSGSYGRETWTEWYEVRPKQVTIYVKAGEETSGTNSY